MKQKILRNYRGLIFFLALLLLGSGSLVRAQTWESASFFNATNWAQLIGDRLGYLYDSHGCLHFAPADIYLLTQTIPVKTALVIKDYGQKSLPAGYQQVPYFRERVNSAADLQYYAKLFKQHQTAILVYPNLERLFIVVDERPFVQVRTNPGPEDFYRLVFEVQRGEEINWDFTLSTPTDVGNYRILGVTDHYLSNTYRQITTVPFGAWVVKQGKRWLFREKGQWFPAPRFIADDLAQPYGQQVYLYYDYNLDKQGGIAAARWASNDFGKYALLWSRDGRTRYPELGYCEGLLLYEQIILVKDLADLLTYSGSDSLEAAVAQNNNFQVYQQISGFLQNSGEAKTAKLNQVACSYVRLFKGFKLTSADQRYLDPRVVKAVQQYQKRKSAPSGDQRQRQLGLYYFARDHAYNFDKLAGWYALVKDNWPFFSELRKKLRQDFMALGLSREAERQLAVEGFLNDRLEFRQVNWDSLRKK